ncbi:MAG: hypothetical protein FJ308_21775 [Planctomycetes bacterium]|nr:hypothetical protein [Planctomycetota bacterium]
MLVLSRKEGERIVIGDNITLVVSKVSGNRVTIGIEAPREVKVVRGELEDSIRVMASGQSAMEDPLAVAVGVLASTNNSEAGNGSGSFEPPVKRATLREFAATVLPMHRQVG